MSSIAVMSSVYQRVEDFWTYTPIYAPNTAGAVPADNTAFLELLYPVATETQMSFGNFGNNAHEELGAFRLSLYIPAGVGLAPELEPWMLRIEELMALFRGASFDGIDCLGFVGPTVRDDSDDGAYYEVSFAVSYRRIITG